MKNFKISFILVLVIGLLVVVYGCNKHLAEESEKSNQNQESTSSSYSPAYVSPSYLDQIKDIPWIKENASFLYSSTLVFNESIHIDSLLTIHKENIGFSKEDSFVQTREETQPSGNIKVTLEHYYKGIHVKINQFSVYLDSGRTVGSISKNFILTAPQLYSTPVDKQVVLEKVAKAINYDYTTEDKSKNGYNYLTSIELVFRNPLKKRGIEPDYNWSRSGPMKFIYTVYMGPDEMGRYYDVDVDAITGKIMEIDYGTNRKS